MSRIVDPLRFRARGGLIDWQAVGRTHPHSEPGALIAERRHMTPRVVQLRWVFDHTLGYPITPFTVWVRRSTPGKQPVKYSDTGFGLSLDGSYVDLWLDVQSAAGGVAMAFSGMPLASGPVDMDLFTAGNRIVRLSGPEMRVVIVTGGAVVNSIQGTRADVQDDPAWLRVEVVGLPSMSATSTFTDLSSPQGLLAAPVDPVAAALDRFRRGAPFYGWHETLPGGSPVPPWVLADPATMIKVFNAEMLDDFIDMCDFSAPSQQSERTYTRTLPADAKHSADATFNPLRLLLYGGISDPLVSLVLGLGTAYPWSWLETLLPSQQRPTLAAVTTPVSFDFMVTSTFLDDLGNKTEWAALVLGPGPVNPPPAPANLAATSPGILAPEVLDDAYRSVVNVAWDAASTLLPFDVGSHALARRSLAPAGPVELVMDPRTGDVALQPLGASRNDAQPNRRSLSDAAWRIDSGTVPNSLRHAVASQDIFGLWSQWSETGLTVQEPPVGPVAVTAARLDVTAQAGVCPAAIACDITWNWTSRSPLVIDLVARRYSQTWASDPPGNTTPPTADAFAAAGAGLLARLHFNAAGAITAVTPGAGLAVQAQHVSLDGNHVSAAPLSDRTTRRYRLLVSGFDLDFDAASRWGVALWGHGTEARPPGRIGTAGTPAVVSAADPRPPVINTTYDNVTLASLRDAQGLHHARLTWSPMAGAVAHQVYTCSEATFRAFHGQPEPRMSDTLTQRLFQLQQLFGANPDRRPFTRIGTEPVAGTSLQVVLPRGTKEIHMYVVIGVSAGNVESAWPTTADPLCSKRFTGIAAPATVTPGAPTLEVTRGDDGAPVPTYHAKLRITSVPGAEVGRIELHRVRVPEAAAAVETMGPPVLALTGPASGWSVVPVTASGDGPSSVGVAQPLGVLTGTDAVPGSWKPVHYRAVAWGRDDATRGQYGTRSAPSTPRSVVVPPSGPPDLGSPTFVLPTPGSFDVRIDFATAAPLPDTVLGPHRLEAEALLVDDTGQVVGLDVQGQGPLSALPGTAPIAGASGVWHDATAGGSTPLHLLVRRADPALRITVRLRITDPLGRLSEKYLDVPKAVVPLPPDIVNPVLTALAKGWLLTFVTHAPDSTASGALQLLVEFSPARGRPITAGSDVEDLPVPPRSTGRLFQRGGPPIPMYASPRRAGLRTIGVGLPGPGVVTVTLRTGDEATTITRRVGRRLFP